MYQKGMRRSSDLANVALFLAFFIATGLIAWNLFGLLDNPIASAAKLAKDIPQQLAGKPAATAVVAPSAEVADATAEPTVEAAPTAAAPQPTAFIVANTGGDGVYLRRSPNPQDRLRAWPDKTRMESAGPDVDVNGLIWKQVRDPAGNVGYIPQQYLSPAN